ncbi:MAG TPA: hypothetical protein VFQ35_10990 [Polyangiaceae bacterium]|nr:hypothetical protein [Polyangiaceae bacterium]
MLVSRALYIGVGLVLLLLAAVALRPRRELSGAGWELFRCFWPSWRFFDSADALPILRARAGRSEEELGPFRDVLRAPRRGPSTLLLNGAFNLELQYFSCVEALARESELVDVSEVRGLISYELVRRLVESRLLESESVYQFALCEPKGGDAHLVSELHTRGGP